MDDDSVLLEGIGPNPTKAFVEKFFNGGLERDLETKKQIDISNESLAAAIKEIEESLELIPNVFNNFPSDFKREIDKVSKKIIDWSICFQKQSTV